MIWSKFLKRDRNIGTYLHAFSVALQDDKETIRLESYDRNIIKEGKILTIQAG